MKSQDFNDGWKVSVRGSMFERGTAEVSDVNLPHDALLTTGRSGDDGDAHLSYYREGTWQYTRALDVPADWASRRITLLFEGVYRDAMVYVNGAFARQSANGYLPFHVPLDPYLCYGATNEILVEAQVHSDSRWYSGGGIYRPVRLLIGDLVHVAPSGIKVSTPFADADLGCVQVITPIVNASPVTQRVELVVEIRDQDGRVVGSETKPVTVLAGETAQSRTRCFVKEPRLWSAEAPNLYSAHVTLRTPDGQHDDASTRFGMRTVSLDAVRGLRINGEVVKLRGASLHHDHGILGAAEFERSAERRVATLKAAGFNAIRSGGHSTSRAMLDAADRHGLYVLDETWDMWHMSKTTDDYSRRFEKWWQEDIDTLVARDFNHPSVIGYSIGSEIIEIGTRHGARMSRLIAERFRELDPSRFLSNSINAVMNMWVNVPDEPAVSMEMLAPAPASGDRDDAQAAPAESGNAEADNSFNATAKFMQAISALPAVGQRLIEAASTTDVFGLNYGHVRVAIDKDAFPNRVMLNTETFPASIAESWQVVRDNPQVIGDFTWAGWDYLGEPGVGRPIYPGEPDTFTAPWPWLTAHCGDIDLAGRRTPISYYREVVFGLNQGPYVAVQNPFRRDHPVRPQAWTWTDSLASWTWDLEQGSPITVEAYADADEIAFHVNGVEAARGVVGAELPYFAKADVPYSPGTVEAVAIKGGVEVGRCELQSAGAVARIGLSADRKEIAANSQELVYIEISLEDASGRTNTASDANVAVAIEGPASLQGLGSAIPKTEDASPFLGDNCLTYRGRALAAVRYCPAQGDAPGGQSVKVKVSCGDLPASVIELMIK